MLFQEYQHLLSLVQHAGDMLKEEAARPTGPRGKDSKAPIDLEIENYLKDEICRVYPNDSILCEEGDHVVGTTDRCFVIDPHDGTSDFLKGHRESSVSVALVSNDKFLFAMVYAPIATALTGENGLFVSWCLGEDLLCNRQKISPSAISTTLTEKSTILVSRKTTEEHLKQNKEFVFPASIIPCASIATRLALVAVGQADAAITVRHPLADWDFAAGQALLQAAGGDLVGPHGFPIVWKNQRSHTPNYRGYFGARHLDLARDIAVRFSSVTQ